MVAALAASILETVLGLELASTGPDAANRFALEGLALRPKDGALEIGIRKLEAASLRLASGPFVLEIGRLALHDLAGQVRMEDGRPRLSSFEAPGAELSAVKVQGPLVLAEPPAAEGSWRLGPLAAVEGHIRAKILDAHLLFDADVTIPIRQGLIDFNKATVEHVGPDSRMGVSRMGIYVDAPNGRSYLYQFPSAPVAGVAYERRGALLGPRVSDRGNLRLQPFGEALMRQGAGHGPGLTEQARLLLDRTALSGEVRPGDGTVAAPGVQADLTGRAEGRNVVRLHSEAVGRGITGEMASLSVRNAVLKWRRTELSSGDIAGALTLRLFVEGTQLRFALELGSMKLSGLRGRG